MKSILVCVLMLGCCFAGCGGTPDAASEASASEALPFLKRHDLDGDGKPDELRFTFSGGAHCCYSLSIQLSSETEPHDFPFMMDGGYIGGVDGSQPGQFDVRNFDDDALPEVFMKIETYNGKATRLDSSWKRLYGITDHSIVIEYEDGKLRCRNAG